mgnify:CR=1 FL=1
MFPPQPKGWGFHKTDYMNNAHLEGEIKGFYGDLKATQETLSYERENLAKTLKNGLGEAMIEYLNNPPKPNRWKGLKMRIKRWWNNRKSGR